jgi:hypothetical protein
MFGETMNYRLHIDVPLVADMNQSVAMSKQLIEIIKNSLVDNNIENIKINYRLGNDEDRQKSNYLNINENGHASNKKSIIEL